MNEYWKIINIKIEKSWYIFLGVRNGYLSFENTYKIKNALNISLDVLNDWK